MLDLAEVARQLGRVEANTQATLSIVAAVRASQEAQERRIRAVERQQSLIKGGLFTIGGLVGALGFGKVKSLLGF